MNPKIIPGIDESHFKKILGLFTKLKTSHEVILFGSRAKGNFREGSDIDLALKGKNISPELISDLLLQYQELYLPWKLDLILYSAITEPALIEHIDRVGVILSSNHKS